MAKDYRTHAFRLLAAVIDRAGSFLPQQTTSARPIRRVLIVKCDRIGDTFLATPAIQALRQCFADAHLAVMCAPWNRPVLENCPQIDAFHVASSVPDIHASPVSEFLSRGRVRILAEEIAATQPDLVVDLQGNPLVVAAMNRAGTPLRIGFGGKLLSFLLTHQAVFHPPLHQSAIYLSIPRLLGFRAVPPPLRMWPTPAVRNEMRARVTQLGLQQAVVFHLGAGRSFRRWPVGAFCELGVRLRDAEPNRPLIVIGDSSEEPLAAHFERSVGRTVFNWSGKLTLEETYTLLGSVAAVVANESGPGHLAAAQGTPVVSLMSSWSDIPRWRALGSNVTILHREGHRCSGPRCRLDPCPNMTAIRPEEVYAALANWLAARQDR